MDVYDNPLAPRSGGDVVERIDYTNGIKVYLRGYAHPWKGLPSEGAVNAINVVKKLLLEILKLHVLLLTPRKAYRAFESVVEKVMGPHILKPQFQMPLTRELALFLENCGISHMLSQSIAHVFEYDSAYRFRLQDMLTHASYSMLIIAPGPEIKRLVEINRKKDYLASHKKIKQLATLLRYALLVPTIRKRFTKAIELSTTKNFMLDKDDAYWLSLRTDYGEGNQNPIV